MSRCRCASRAKARPRSRTASPNFSTWVGLADRIESRPPTLSGGQQQRVAIARAVIGRPSLILADEPTGNVDDEMALRLLRLLEEMNRLGTTVIVATHNNYLASRSGHPHLHLDGGEVKLIKGGMPERPPEPEPSSGSPREGLRDDLAEGPPP